MQKLVVIFGGSFNPSTIAHAQVALMALEQTGADEAWLLVSPQNPFKSKEGMASFDDRFAMAKLNVADHPQLVVKDLEAEYVQSEPGGVIETADTLRRMQRDFPDHRFIWAMGADNFVDFHKWGHAQFIADNFPIVIVPREGYMAAALHSQTATALQRISNSKDLRASNGWFMLGYDPNGINATECRAELGAGQMPAAMRPNVARYALNHKLYRPLLTL